MIICDSNILSEAMKPSPAPEVLRWLAAFPASSLLTTTITQAEILYGIKSCLKGNGVRPWNWQRKQCLRKISRLEFCPLTAMLLESLLRFSHRAERWVDLLPN